MWRLGYLRQSVKRTTCWDVVASRHKQKTIINSRPTETRERENPKTWCCLLLIFTTSIILHTITQDDRSGACDRVTHKKTHGFRLDSSNYKTPCITFYFSPKTFLFWLSTDESLTLCETWLWLRLFRGSSKWSPFLPQYQKGKKEKRPLRLRFLFRIHGSTFTRQYSGHLLEIFKGKDVRMRAKNTTFSNSHRQNVEVDSDHLY